MGDTKTTLTREDVHHMWTTYHVRWDFLTKLCGSVPADPKIVEAWIKARQPKARPPSGKSLDEIQTEVLDTLAAPDGFEEEIGGAILQFQRWPIEHPACVVRAATIKAHIKDCARVLSTQYVGSIQGEKAFSTRVINGVYPDEREYWIPVLRADGSPVTQPDGTMDKAIHIRGPRGPQSAIKQFEYIEGARLDFKLKILTAKGNKPSVSQDDLAAVFTYGGVHGYAGERGDGEGKYTFTFLKIEA